MNTTPLSAPRCLVLAAAFLAAASLHAANVARVVIWNKSNTEWKLRFPEDAAGDMGKITVEDGMNPSLPADSLQGGRPLMLLSKHAYYIAYTVKSSWLTSDPPSSRKFWLYDPAGKASEEFHLGYPESVAHKANTKSKEHNVKEVLQLKLDPPDAADSTFVRTITILKDAYGGATAP